MGWHPRGLPKSTVEPQKLMGNWGLLLGVLWLLVGGTAMARTPLEQTLGRNETRIFSARWEVAAGLTLRAQQISLTRAWLLTLGCSSAGRILGIVVPSQRPAR